MVRATRNPNEESRAPVESQPRFAERSSGGAKFQEPPRNTRWEQSPDLHALPSAGALK